MSHPHFIVPFNICLRRMQSLREQRPPEPIDNRDLAEAFELFERVSRSMSVGVKLMGEPLDGVVAVAYLVCKLADGAEDVVPDGTRDAVTADPLWRLKLIEAVRNYIIARHQKSPANPDLVRACLPVTRADEAHRIALLEFEQICDFMMLLPPDSREVVVYWAIHMLNGMLWGAEQDFRFSTDAELGYYSWAVAGTVGYMLSDLLVLYSPAHNPNTRVILVLAAGSENFGVMLQETNYLRNLAEDSQRLGHSFVSDELCARFGLTPENLCSPENQLQAMRVVEVICLQIFSRGETALAYINSLPKTPVGLALRRFCLFSLLMAVRTAFYSLTRKGVLEPDSPDIKVPRSEVEDFIRVATEHAGSSDEVISELFTQVRTEI